MNRTIIFIPYYAPGAQGCELQLAIAGWRQFFTDDYVICIVGENLPHVGGDDVLCIESGRVGPVDGMYRQHLDYVRCMKACHAAFPDSVGFIFAADDNYLIRPCSTADIQVVKYRDDDYNVNPLAGGWKRDKYRTRQLLDRMGLPHRNYTTHVPCWFEWAKLEAVWERYDMEHQSYVIEDLYYNTYAVQDGQIQCSEVKFQLCDLDDADFMESEMAVKTFICNSPDGYSAALEERLIAYYGIGI